MSVGLCAGIRFFCAPGYDFILFNMLLLRFFLERFFDVNTHNGTMKGHNHGQKGAINNRTPISALLINKGT